MKFCGSIEVGSRYFLAPMAGVADRPFRMICEDMGAALTYTEMVSARALCYHDRKTSLLLDLEGQKCPCVAQIFGHEPDVMAEGARLALAMSGADAIDINMGCPMPKITNNGDGAALMLDLPLASSIIGAVKRAVDVPVTVKFRKGYGIDSFSCDEFARMACVSGADALTIHGRTRAAMYSGVSDLKAVEAVKKVSTVPVIASGDGLSPLACREILNKTGAVFIMVARGAQGWPFIFEDLLALDLGEEPTMERGIDALLQVMVTHARLAIAQKGETKAMIEFRKHGLWYLGRVVGGKVYKPAMASLNDFAGLLSLCETISRNAPKLKEVYARDG